jgi:Ca-activated chloride channel family protein
MAVKVYTVGVGTEGVAPIPVQDPVFGPRYVFQPVDLDEKTLRRIADETEGRYFRATDARTLEDIFRRIDALERTEVTVRERVRRSEMFPLLVLLGALLLLAESVLGWTLFRQVP